MIKTSPRWIFRSIYHFPRFSRVATMKEGGALKGGGFHTTRWSGVFSAAHRANPKNQEALSETQNEVQPSPLTPHRMLTMIRLSALGIISDERPSKS